MKVPGLLRQLEEQALAYYEMLDIIKAEFDRPENTSSIFQQRIWVNDKLIWDVLNKIGDGLPTYTVTR